MRTFTTSLFLHLYFLAQAQDGAWQVFYPSLPAKCVAAKGNTILASAGTGLAVFDTAGNQQLFLMTNSSIPSNSIRQVAVDAAGHWWVESPEGIARYDGNDWQVWSLADAGIPGATVKVLKSSPDGSTYAGTSLGVAIFQNGAWSALNTSNSGLPSDDVRDITFDSLGNAYFATSAGLAIQNGANWTIHNAASTGFTNFNNVKSVAVTAAGVVWVTEGVTRFAKFESGAWTEYVAADIGLTGAVFSGAVFYDEFDRLWLTHTKSISVLSGGNWTHYPETEVGCTFPVNLQNSIFLATDGAGQLWATACGLSLFDGQTWEPQQTGNSGLPTGYVFSIAEGTDGDMWFGSTGGIGKLDTGGNWSNFNPVDFGATDDDVYDILSAAAGDVWFGLFEEELLRFDGNDWVLFDTCSTAFPELLTSNLFVRASAEAPNGDLWFSLAPVAFFGARLARYSSSGEWTFYDPSNSSVTNDSDVEAIAISSDGTAWFASSFQGLYRFDGVNWTTFTTANSDLPGDRVHDLAFAPDGALWACTDMGLARFDGTDWTVLSTTNSGLPSDNTLRIAFDGIGGMYVGLATAGTDPKCVVLRNGEWKILTPPSLEGAFIEAPYAFTVDSDNRLWLTYAYFNLSVSSPGVFVYEPEMVSVNEDAQPSTGISVFPNPATGSLFFQGLENAPASICIRNSQGQQVLEASFSNPASSNLKVDIGQFPSGIYWATVLQNGLAATMKVVKL